VPGGAPRPPARRDRRGPLPLYLFVGLYFAAYFLAYAWFIGIAPSIHNRHALAQFLPLLVTFALMGQEAASGLTLRVGRHRIAAFAALSALVLAVLAVDLYFILTHRIVQMYAGG
jgi:hypothetical protein